MTYETLLVYPVLAQILLMLLGLVWLGYLRVRDVQQKRVYVKAIAVSSAGWREEIQKVSNNFNNQFQVPVLFFVLCLLVMLLKTGSLLFVGLAWGFVASRVLHSLIHITYNNVLHRFVVYLTGVAIVAVMAAYVAVSL